MKGISSRRAGKACFPRRAGGARRNQRSAGAESSRYPEILGGAGRNIP